MRRLILALFTATFIACVVWPAAASAGDPEAPARPAGAEIAIGTLVTAASTSAAFGMALLPSTASHDRAAATAANAIAPARLSPRINAASRPP